MAIRRISDLPSLSAAFSNATADKCLVEVSYPTDQDTNQNFDSYYANAAWIAQNAGTVTATSSQLGSVQIGDNISVNVSGVISVPKATSQRYGVVKFPLNTSVGVLGVANGQLVDNTSAYASSTATENQFELSTVFDIIYPIGSLYIAMNNATPPGTGDAKLRNPTWVKIDDDCTLWSSALNDLTTALPQTSADAKSSSYYVTEQLPMPPNLSCSKTGEHTHKAPFPSVKLAHSNNHYGQASIPPEYTYDTKAAGDHVHAIGYKKDTSIVYADNAHVRPRGLKCAIYVRVS